MPKIGSLGISSGICFILSIIFAASLQKYFKITEMNTLSNFNQFLNSAYHKILEACLQDEAIETLKILENKEYLQLRINQLFSEIYVAQREKKIEELIRLVNSYEKGAERQSGTAENKCRKCDSLSCEIRQKDRDIESLNKKIAEMTAYEYKETKRIESLLLKQNEQMKKQIKQMQLQLTEVLFSENSQREQSSVQILRLKQQTKKEMQQKIKEIETLRKDLAHKMDEIKSLSNRLIQYAQRREAEQKQMREMISQLKNVNLMKEKQQNQISILKNEQHLLIEKINRLQMDFEFLREKNKLLEKENKGLKMTNNDILDSHSSKEQSTKQNRQQSNDLLIKVQNLLKNNVQLERKNKNIKQEFEMKLKQLQQKNLFLQKNNFMINEDLRKNQIKYDKDIRQLKQELKRINQQLTSQFQETKQSHIELITKQYNIKLAQTNREIEKLREQNRNLNRTLLKTQQSINEIVSEHSEQKNKLVQQIEKEKSINKEMRSYLNKEKSSTSLMEQENHEKYKELQNMNKEMKKELESRQKEIKELRKETTKMVEQQNNKISLIQNLKSKCQRLDSNIDQNQAQLKRTKDQLRSKDKIIKDIQKKNELISQEKEQLQNKCVSLTKNFELAQLRAKRISEELHQKKELMLSLQKDNQNQIIDIYEHTHIFASQNRKQIESYYMNLLKEQHQSKISSEFKELNSAKEKQLLELRTQKEEVQEKMFIIKTKYSEQLKQRENFESKVVTLLDEIDKLRIENSRLSQILREQKRNATGMVRAYQQKMIQYYNMFGEFKRQLYLNLKTQLTKIKQDLRYILTFVQNELQKSKQWIAAYCFKLNQEVETMSSNFRLKQEKIKHQYDFGVVMKLQEQKREMKMQCELSIKEKSMEFYTIIAQKQHILAEKQQKQAQLYKHIREIQTKNEQIQKIARQNHKKQEEMKEIVAKMNNKVNQAEKQSSLLKNEVEYYRKENGELKKEINNLQASFKEKIQKCRENYAVQNDRLFAKYEKEFAKLIVSSKKGMEYSSLLQHSSSCNNILIPTKGDHNDNKLQKIQKQIQEQKKKLNLLQQGLEDKTKYEKTIKFGAKQAVRSKK